MGRVRKAVIRDLLDSSVIKVRIFEKEKSPFHIFFLMQGVFINNSDAQFGVHFDTLLHSLNNIVTC